MNKLIHEGVHQLFHDFSNSLTYELLDLCLLLQQPQAPFPMSILSTIMKILQDNIMELYYGIILWDNITELYYRIMLRTDIMELFTASSS